MDSGEEVSGAGVDLWSELVVAAALLQRLNKARGREGVGGSGAFWAFLL